MITNEWKCWDFCGSDFTGAAADRLGAGLAAGFVQALTRIIVVVAALLLAGWIAGKLAEPAARWLEPILSEKLEQRLTA